MKNIKNEVLKASNLIDNGFQTYSGKNKPVKRNKLAKKSKPVYSMNTGRRTHLDAL